MSTDTEPLESDDTVDEPLRGIPLKRPLHCTHPECDAIATTDSQANGGLLWSRKRSWSYSPRAGERCPKHRLPNSLNWIMRP